MENATLFASKKANLQLLLLSNSLLEVVVDDPWNIMNYRPYPFYPPLPSTYLPTRCIVYRLVLVFMNIADIPLT
jgi:hypothetical protein